MKNENSRTITLLTVVGIPIALVIATVVAYLPSLWYAFQFDDEPSILRFYAIRFKGLGDLFFTTSRWVSFWLNTIHYKLGQFKPFVYRRTNLIFHCASGILVYALILSLLRLRPKDSRLHAYAHIIAGITSAFFLLHPIQTQTVSYVIQGQLEGLSALFCLAVLLCFVWCSQSANKRLQTLITFAIFCLCIIACGTKEITIVLPILALLIDWFFIAHGSWSALKSRWWLHAIIATTIIGCYVWLLGKKFFINVLSLNVECTSNVGNMLTETVGQKITPWPFFISQFKVILHYLLMFLWPLDMCVDYDWKLCTSLTDIDCVLPLIAIMVIFASIAYALRNNRTSLYAFGLLWFFVCIAPRSSIMPATELMCDYKTYLASVGWLLVLALLLLAIYQWAQKKIPFLQNTFITLFLALLAIVLLGLSIYERNKVWRSGRAFWCDITEKSPGKARGYNNYGVCLLDQHNVKLAIWCFKKAIQLEPFTYPDPYNNLSAAYAIEGRLDLAILALKASLKINRYQPKSYNNLGIFFMQKKQLDWAEKAFQQAILIAPHYGKAHFNLGRVYLDQNEIRKAWQAFKNACTQADYDTEPQGVASYAQTSMHLHEYADAVRGYEMLLQIMPNNQQAAQGLAKARQLCSRHVG